MALLTLPVSGRPRSRSTAGQERPRHLVADSLVGPDSGPSLLFPATPSRTVFTMRRISPVCQGWSGSKSAPVTTGAPFDVFRDDKWRPAVGSDRQHRLVARLVGDQVDWLTMTHSMAAVVKTVRRRGDVLDPRVCSRLRMGRRCLRPLSAVVMPQASRRRSRTPSDRTGLPDRDVMEIPTHNIVRHGQKSRSAGAGDRDSSAPKQPWQWRSECSKNLAARLRIPRTGRHGWSWQSRASTLP